MKALLVVAALLLCPPAFAATLQPLDQSDWADIRKSHAGRPTIIHFWGTTCGPCLVELPAWGNFYGKHSGLDLILVEADQMPAQPEHITALLHKAGLGRAESWALADPFDDRLRYGIDAEWAGELPLTLLVGRDGTVTRLLGSVDFVAINRWLTAQTEGR